MHQHDVDAWPGPDSIDRAELLRRVAGADAVVSLLTERIDAELLDAAGPQLKVVANVAVGYDNIDVPACSERDVVATNTPGVLTDATADIAFGLILMATRRLGEGERLIRSGQSWKWGMFFLLGSGLQGKTLGVVGMGGIGQATARRAKAFGMEIVYQSRSEIDPGIAADQQAQGQQARHGCERGPVLDGQRVERLRGGGARPARAGHARCAPERCVAGLAYRAMRRDPTAPAAPTSPERRPRRTCSRPRPRRTCAPRTLSSCMTLAWPRMGPSTS